MLKQRARRLRFALSYFWPGLGAIIPWLWRSREVANFTYDLTDDNKRYLASTVSTVTGLPVSTVERYVAELENDGELRQHVAGLTARGPASEVSDLVQHYGRRLGWYAFARALKPAVIVETGVEKGLGACVLARALIENAKEGHPGRYFGTDIDRNAGYLFKPPYSDVGQILYGDSITSLQEFDLPIGMFVNDSDHSADYEAREYRVVAPMLSKNSIVLGDNAHSTRALRDFAAETGRKFLFFAEKPKEHWYPGAGIGIAFAALDVAMSPSPPA